MENNKEQSQIQFEENINNKSRIKQNYEVIKLLFKYMKANKKWWLLPFLFVLAFFGIFISFVGNSSVMPLIYALF